LVRVDNRALGESKKHDGVIAAVEQSAKQLKLVNAFLQLRVVALSSRVSTEPDDPGP
jgi:hypothetical protein